MEIVGKCIRLVVLALAATVVACGGGTDTCVDVTGGNACGSGGGTPTPSASDLVLVLSATTVPNDGSQSVQATATALDSNRNTIASVPVSISVDAGAIATASSSVTDQSGVVKAAIGIGSDRSNRVVNVTARTGSITKTAQLNVVAAVGGGGIAVADLVLTLSSNTIANTGNETIVATAIALSSTRNVIAGVPVEISVNSNAVAIPSGSLTSSSGQLTASVGIGADRSNRTIVVTAVGGGITRAANLQVTDAGAVGAPSDMILALSSPSISNTGTETVTAIATTLDARRNTLANVPVSITVNANAVATPARPATGTDGTLSATIGIGSDRTNREISVTATAPGGVTRAAVLTVTDAPVSGVPVANDLSLALSAPTLDNGGTNTITATVTAVDRNRNVLPGIPVTVRVDESAVAAVSSSATNSSGVVTAVVGIGANRSNRNITVTAVSGTLTRTASFAVVGARLTASFAPRVSAGASDRIEYTLVDTNSLPMVGQAISVTASNNTVRSGSTDSNGKFAFQYTAPNQAGTLLVSATAAGVTREIAVEVSPGTIDPVDSSLAIRSASLAATPSVVTVNSTASSENQAELRALFVGVNSATGQDSVPIPRVRARFRILNNADGSLGSVSWVGGAYAISDDSGVARATYRPGTRSSATDGVVIQMCWDRDDFTVPPEPTLDTTWCTESKVDAKLTVVDEALSVNIRTNELVKSGAANLTYIKEFVVMVVDAAGQAKADVQITPSVDLLGYHKGFYYFDTIADRWVQVRTLAADEDYQWNGGVWVKSGLSGRPMCPNEDANRNGVLDSSEDLNQNMEIDPRKADIAIKMVGSSKTDANGLAIVQIEYGRNLATWVDFIITVTASGVSGTEARARFVGSMYGVGNLQAPGTAVTNENVAPAFVVSPYGLGSYIGDPITGVGYSPVGGCTNTQ